MADTVIVAPANDKQKVIYWHRELPPIDAEAVGEHVVEASSVHIKGALARGDELWDRCHDDLMAQVRERLEQEVARLGGHYAHVRQESIESRHNDATDEGWLHGRFSYLLLPSPNRTLM